MSCSAPSLPHILSRGFFHAGFRAAVEEALNWVPELKHEGLVCTHLSSALRKLGYRSVREVTVGRRRFDMQIENYALEAKYHFEGDVFDVLNSLEPNSNYVYNPKGWNSARKAIHDELNRGTPSWFVWMVCVRDPESNEEYIYPKLRDKFISKNGASDFSSMIEATELLLRSDVVSAFERKLVTHDFDLPTIRGHHSALVTRLFHVEPA